MQFIYNGTIDELKEALHAKAKELHRDIRVYQDEPDIFMIGFLRSSHNGGRFFVANITEENGKTILTGEAKDIIPDSPRSGVQNFFDVLAAFALIYSIMGLLVMILWLPFFHFSHIWIPLLLPVAVMVILRISNRDEDKKADARFVKFMSIVTGEEIPIPKNSQDLYRMLMNTRGLHSSPQFGDDVVTWDLYEGAYVEAYMNECDTSIHVISHDPASCIHWHPDPEDICEELYTLGKQGNILVLRKKLIGTEVFYMGPPDRYPLCPTKKRHWGELIYLTQRNSFLHTGGLLYGKER